MTSMIRAVALAVLALGSGADAQKVMVPTDRQQTPMVLVFSGRPDAAEDAYTPLLQEVQKAALSLNHSMWVVAGASFEETKSNVSAITKLLTLYGFDGRVFYMGHGMVDGSGSAAAPAFAATDPAAAGVVLLAGFLKRLLRPSNAACLKTWDVQPTHHCPKGKGLPFCPGGYLPDHVHDCPAPGPSDVAPDYKLPSLTVGGGLDGVVRVARIAEAWYSQRSTPHHEVALVEGMNHADLMAEGSTNIAASDLLSELGPVEAKQRVATLVAQFLVKGASGTPAPDAFFTPFEKMFVDQEGSWWWTPNYDENGSSPWAADAQRRMAEPMPKGFDAWTVSNEFHMLSDEGGIPPYYRDKHRPNVTLSDKAVVGSTVAQLRYIKLSVTDTAVGENGWAIIKEEKAGVLSKLKDDGADYTSAIEIATKLASRQLAYNRTGAAAPDSLDGGDRCKAINQAAYDLALQSASPTARARFMKQGRPLIMVADKSPTPPAGPWWIWNYLQMADKGAAGVEVQSWSAFFSLTALKYGRGNHYCKLLSPARALEWVYTDGMRPLKESFQLLV